MSFFNALNFSWHTALLGFMLCFAMMMIVSYYRAVVFWAFFAAITVLISRSAARNNWGDALAGLMFQQVMYSTLTKC